jgi:hypothetical protein
MVSTNTLCKQTHFEAHTPRIDSNAPMKELRHFKDTQSLKFPNPHADITLNSFYNTLALQRHQPQEPDKNGT